MTEPILLAARLLASCALWSVPIGLVAIVAHHWRGQGTLGRQSAFAVMFGCEVILLAVIAYAATGVMWSR